MEHILMIENENYEIYDCNFWLGNNYLNSRLSVTEEQLKEYIQYLKTEKTSPVIIISNFFSLFYEAIEGDTHLENIIKDNGDLGGSLFFSKSIYFK